MLRVRGLAVMLLASLMLPESAAATTLKDVKVAIRVLDFAGIHAPAGSVLGVFYDSQNRESVEDAQAIRGWVAESGIPGKPELSARLIDVRELAEAAASPVSVAILAKGVEPFYDGIAAYARRYRTLTIASDLACVRADKCVVGVSSSPRVEVMLSQEAASASGVRFSEAFRMMVTER